MVTEVEESTHMAVVSTRRYLEALQYLQVHQYLEALQYPKVPQYLEALQYPKVPHYQVPKDVNRCQSRCGLVGWLVGGEIV